MKELKKKLVEESLELQKAKGRDATLDELADVLEVAQAIAKVHKAKWSEVEKKRKAKRKERGGFQKRIFLREVEEPEVRK